MAETMEDVDYEGMLNGIMEYTGEDTDDVVLDFGRVLDGMDAQEGPAEETEGIPLSFDMELEDGLGASEEDSMAWDRKEAVWLGALPDLSGGETNPGAGGDTSTATATAGAEDMPYTRLALVYEENWLLKEINDLRAQIFQPKKETARLHEEMDRQREMNALVHDRLQELNACLREEGARLVEERARLQEVIARETAEINRLRGQGH
ncbi:hypothetical protein C8A01DRAFT_34609 [Parachaetomium inaequale]|uniref:Uncharacterized protein n=1 Tax=Parachaetomium inaequale TaxID=2588326 RepID=A0AAN6PIJ1_9PEZI|nr:hypothetical protein C8A01DRAFT_34609 [Parachaetomium inaequale]